MTALFDPALRSFFEELADAAGKIALRYFRQPLEVEVKSDLSPVTQADRAIERELRAMITSAYPNDGIFGEEYGQERMDAENIWVLDPIDGTKSFMTGRPLFGTVIGLMRHGRPYAGLVDQPFTKERWFGVTGQGCLYNGQQVQVASGRGLANARAYSYVPSKREAPVDQRFWALRDAVQVMQYNSDCYAYALVAMGASDLVVESGLALYDVAGVIPLIEGAGGLVTDWQGRPIGKDFNGTIIAASCADLAEDARRLLNEGIEFKG